MNKEYYIFYLESYVHVFFKKDIVLLYNTLNGDSILSKNQPMIFRLLRKSLSQDRTFFNIIRKSELKNSNIKEFIDKVKNKYMGDLISNDLFNTKPFFINPKLNLMNGDRLYNCTEKGNIFKKDLIGMMKVLSIYINSRCENNCNICKDAYKQLLFCHKKDRKNEISLYNLKTFFSEADFSNLSK